MTSAEPRRSQKNRARTMDSNQPCANLKNQTGTRKSTPTALWAYLNLKLSYSRVSRMIGCGDHFRCNFSFPLFAPSRLKLSSYSSSNMTFVKVRMHRPM